MLKRLLFIIFFLGIVAMAGYLALGGKNSENKKTDTLALDATPRATVAISPTGDDSKNDGGDGGFKMFKFDSFHGSTDISDKFEFQYPANWYNEGQYFSPNKIQFYDLYSVKAPIYFDLILADIFHLTEFNYQIENSKRRNPDSTGQIDGRDFKRYDLVDYGSYGGDSAGRVKIFVGPKIKIDGDDYYLIFHWEEKPLAEYMAGNNIEVFDNIMLSLKFFK